MGLRDEALPLFEAAEQRAQAIVPEQIEEEPSLPPMTRGREVVEDYRSQGLSLRPHPLAFLRSGLAAQDISPCGALREARDGSRITVSGLVMVRQRPGSAKGVMFITLEDETDIANLIIWPSLFDKQRRREFDRLLALPPAQIGMHHIALDGTGPDDGDLDHEVVEALRSQRGARQRRKLRNALDPDIAKTGDLLLGYTFSVVSIFSRRKSKKDSEK
jgi:DNA polymerase III alpha subunit